MLKIENTLNLGKYFYFGVNRVIGNAMSTRRVTFEQRAHLDDLHRLVLDELCHRYPDKWELVESVSLPAGRRQRQ